MLLYYSARLTLWMLLLGGCLDSNMQLGDKRAAVAAKGVPTVLGVSSVSLQHNRLSCVGATTLLEHVDKESLRYLDLGMSYLSRACVTRSRCSGRNNHNHPSLSDRQQPRWLWSPRSTLLEAATGIVLHGSVFTVDAHCSRVCDRPSPPHTPAMPSAAIPQHGVQQTWRCRHSVAMPWLASLCGAAAPRAAWQRHW